MKYYSVIKENEILPFTTTWMNLENTVLREICQTEEEILYYLSYVQNLKKQTKTIS